MHVQEIACDLAMTEFHSKTYLCSEIDRRKATETDVWDQFDVTMPTKSHPKTFSFTSSSSNDIPARIQERNLQNEDGEANVRIESKQQAERRQLYYNGFDTTMFHKNSFVAKKTNTAVKICQGCKNAIEVRQKLFR